MTLVTLLCLSVAAPAIRLVSALPHFKAEQLLLPVIVAMYAWLVLAGVARPIRWNGLIAVGLLYFACNVISIWYGGQILGHSVIVRDFYELPKVLLPVAFFTIAYETKLSEAGFRRLMNYFSAAILAVCIYAWCQFLGLGFTYRLNSYYSGGGHIDDALKYAGRVYSTMGNANVLGQLMSWCVVLFVLAALFAVGSRLRNAVMAMACLVTLVMTGSRFGLLTVSLGILMIIALVALSGRRGRLQVCVLVLLVPVFAWTYQTVGNANRRTMERYQTLKNPLQIDSLRERLDSIWRDEWQDFEKSPLVGHGPAKTVFTSGFTDSEYLGVLREKGLIGLAVFLGYYFFPLYLLLKGERAALARGNLLSAEVPGAIVAVHAALIMAVLALIMNLAMSTFYTPFLQGFLWLWLGVGARAAISLRARGMRYEYFSARNKLFARRRITLQGAGVSAKSQSEL